jgi:hypothetical protein
MAPDRPSPAARPLVAKVRALCMDLPEVTERLSHGEATWFVRDKKTFVSFVDHHHDDRVGFTCAAPPGAQADFIGRDPERFYRPPYVGGRGWLGVRLDVPGIDWDEVADIIEDAYRTIAPPALIERLTSRR